jgi:hypothetical protein
MGGACHALRRASEIGCGMRVALRSAFLLLTCAVLACASVPAVTFLPDAISPSAAPAPAPVPVAGVAVLNFADDTILPYGIRILRGADQEIAADAPHRVLGTLVWRCYSEHPATNATLIAEAARRGANAVILHRENCCAYALVLGKPPGAPPTETLLAEQARRASRFKPVIHEDRRLDAFEKVTADVKRGRCYTAGYALHPDANLTNRARFALGAYLGGVHHGHDLFLTEQDAGATAILKRRDYLHEIREAFWPEVVCPVENGSITIGVGMGSGSGPFGVGSITLVLYEMPIAEGELSRRASDDHARRVRDYEEGKRREAQACLVCQQYRPACGGGEGSCDAYRECLAAYDASGAECPR